MKSLDLTGFHGAVYSHARSQLVQPAHSSAGVVSLNLRELFACVRPLCCPELRPVFLLSFHKGNICRAFSCVTMFRPSRTGVLGKCGGSLAEVFCFEALL